MPVPSLYDGNELMHYKWSCYICGADCATEGGATQSCPHDSLAPGGGVHWWLPRGTTKDTAMSGYVDGYGGKTLIPQEYGQQLTKGPTQEKL